jgi:hypothetical protein
LRPAHSRCHRIVARLTEGFNHFVSSIVAPVLPAGAVRRVGFTPTGKRRLITAHAISRRSRCRSNSSLRTPLDVRFPASNMIHTSAEAGHDLPVAHVLRSGRSPATPAPPTAGKVRLDLVSHCGWRQEFGSSSCRCS